MTSNPMTALMPCPFCGGEAHYSSQMCRDGLHEFINCLQCCTHGPGSIDKWNTRAHDPRLTALERDLAECYRLSGADPDGNEDWRLATSAVQEVARLRKESDDDTNTIVNLERENAELRRLAYHKNGMTYQAMFTVCLDMAEENAALREVIEGAEKNLQDMEGQFKSVIIPCLKKLDCMKTAVSYDFAMKSVQLVNVAFVKLKEALALIANVNNQRGDGG